MIMKQLEFNFIEEKNNFNINDFIVFDGNIEAFSFLHETNNENSSYIGIFFLIGEEKSGKTYLANIWKSLVNAKFIDYNFLSNLNLCEFNAKALSIVEKYDNYIIDDFNFNKLDEEKFFHLINIIYSANSNLLITTKQNIKEINFSLKDLKSRIDSSIKLKINNLNEDIKELFILKLFSDKKLKLNYNVLEYINKNIKCDYKVIFDFVEKINFFVKQEKRNITIPFIKKFII